MPAIADDPLVQKHWVVASYGLVTDTAPLRTGTIDGKTRDAERTNVVYEAIWRCLRRHWDSLRLA